MHFLMVILILAVAAPSALRDLVSFVTVVFWILCAVAALAAAWFVLAKVLIWVVQSTPCRVTSSAVSSVWNSTALSPSKWSNWWGLVLVAALFFLPFVLSSINP